MVIDVVDATSPQDAHEIQAIKVAGGEPIVMRGMCGAVGQVVQDIISRARGHRQIVLLRFHGHGAPGMMNFGAGTEAHFEHQSGVSVGNFGSVASELARLNLFFAPHGRVENPPRLPMLRKGSKVKSLSAILLCYGEFRSLLGLLPNTGEAQRSSSLRGRSTPR